MKKFNESNDEVNYQIKLFFERLTDAKLAELLDILERRMDNRVYDLMEISGFDKATAINAFKEEAIRRFIKKHS